MIRELGELLDLCWLVEASLASRAQLRQVACAGSAGQCCRRNPSDAVTVRPGRSGTPSRRPPTEKRS
eukprot:6014191-Prymnesium_polylepis.1